MKKHLCTPQFYLFCAVISALIACIAQSIAYFKAYGSPLANYFSASSPLPKIAVGFAILTCVLGIVAVCLWKKDEIPMQSLIGDISSLPAAVGFLAGMILMLLSGSTVLTYAIAVCFFFATHYHVIPAFRLINNRNERDTTALIGFSNVIGCILMIGYFYFDPSMEMNAPVKIGALIAILFVALYYTSEIRVLLGNPLPKFYTLAIVCTTGIGALASLPVALAYMFFHCFDYTMPNPNSSLPFRHPEYLACSLVLIGVCTTTVWRLCRLIRASKN